ncbi:MAG: BspA family leucine-rich repeat surface protein [Clostridia bacterium]|nr:BspA family leucine-rich repeat surface protein [Clostridia bacterium]
MKKRIISLFLCVAMCFALMPTVHAMYIATDRSWEIDDKGRLRIFGSVENDAYYTKESPWHNYVTRITSVITQDGAKIDSGASLFAGCTNMVSADLSHLDTSSANTLSGMFRDCSSLKTVNLTGIDTSNVMEMYHMFNGCSSLTSLNLSGFNTTKVTLMHSMFANCSSLTELDLGNFNTARVMNMASMFAGCSNLRTLNIKNFDTTMVTAMDYMFNGCSSLTELDLSHFNTARVASMRLLFADCSSLQVLDVSNFNLAKATYRTQLFSNCTALKKINASADVINKDAVQLKTLSLDWIDETTGKTLTALGTVSGKVTLVRPILGSTDEGWYLDVSGCLHIVGLVTNNSTTTVGKTPWENYKDQIKTVVVEEGGRVENGMRLFAGCKNLTGADLQQLNTFNMKTAYLMFSGCSSLMTVNFGNLDLTGVTVRSMFKNCTALAVIRANNSVISQTADQLIEISPMWHSSVGTVYNSAESMQGITGTVILLKGALLGDLNSDNRVNGTDIALLKQALLHRVISSVYDIDANATVDVRDLVRLKKIAAGIA